MLGTIESVGGLSVDAMRDYFHRRYAPNNIVLAAAGRVNFDRLVADCRRICGDWEPGACARTEEPARPRNGFHRLAKPSATQQYLLRMSPGPAARDANRYPAKVLAMILGDDSGSRLYWELVDPGLAEVAGLTHFEHQEAGVFSTLIISAPEDADEVLERVVRIYEAAHAEGITEAELQQAKNKVRSHLVLSSESPSQRMLCVGDDWCYRHEYRSLETDLGLVASIRLDEVADVLARYSLLEGTSLTIGPE